MISLIRSKSEEEGDHGCILSMDNKLLSVRKCVMCDSVSEGDYYE